MKTFYDIREAQAEIERLQQENANYEEEIVAQIAITRKREAQIAELRNDLTAARLELEALRRCLRGIASCATCEVCRGAAQSHLHPKGDPHGQS